MTSRCEVSPPSGDSSSLTQLSTEQRERLTEVLDRYLSALEHGAPLSQQAILAEQPDLAGALATYFRSLEDLHDMAAGFAGGPSSTSAPTENGPAGEKRIGDFELVREIGRGGMGVVYEARQISLDRRVAVKLLPFAAVLDAKQIARFKHEAQAAAQLHHPNIVPVFAIGVESGVHYYAMQYIDGQPLDVAIKELQSSRSRRRGARSRATSASLFGPSIHRSATDDTRDDHHAATHASCLVTAAGNTSEHYRTVMRLGIQAAEALHAAHEYGVVHRDIKPSNLLIEAGGKLWITDFGLARFQRDMSLTRTGDLIGTMRYMSPEQAAGQPALVDHRVDIYSLGVTLYELLCLQPAFPEDRGPQLLRQIDSYDPPRPRQVRPDIPTDLETVILKAMARERDERYATAQELAADLKRVLEGKPTKAKSPTPLDRAGRWVRRRQKLVAGTLLALVLTVAGLTASIVMIASARWHDKMSAERADRMYTSAREMLDRLGMQMAEDLGDVPGAEHVRQKLLMQTRMYYQTFIEEAKSDPQLRAAAGVAYGKIGSLLDQLGSKEESLEAHEQAASIFQQLAAVNTGDFSTAQQLALAENNLGLALMRLGKTQAAQQQFEAAISRQEKLLARQPHDTKLEGELALSLCNLGLLQHELHHPTQAEASFKTAIGRLERTAVTSEGAEGKKQLATAYNNLAAVYVDARPVEAARLNRKALELLQLAAQTDSGNLALRRNMGVTLNNLGSALARAQQFPAARAAHDQAIEIREGLMAQAPARMSYRTDLAVSLNNLGMLESRWGHTDAAEAAFRRGLVQYETLLAQFPADSTVQSSLGSVYNNLGIALEQGGQLEAAASAFAAAVEHQQAALAKSPELPRGRELLAKHRENQARVVRKLPRDSEGSPTEQPAHLDVSSSGLDYDKSLSGIERPSSPPRPIRPEP